MMLRNDILSAITGRTADWSRYFGGSLIEFADHDRVLEAETAMLMCPDLIPPPGTLFWMTKDEHVGRVAYDINPYADNTRLIDHLNVFGEFLFSWWYPLHLLLDYFSLLALPQEVADWRKWDRVKRW